MPGAHGEIAALARPAEAGAPSGFHHIPPLSRLPCLGGPEPCTGCCEPSSCCLQGGRRKIAQGGDVCFFSSCSQYSWHPQQYITPFFNRVGKNAFTILSHQKGFILVSVVLWTIYNEELWETRCQSSAGGALTLPAGRAEPLLGLLAGVASHPPSRFSFQSTWGIPLLVSLPCVPTGTSQLRGTAGRN